jgi:hypothetical protein
MADEFVTVQARRPGEDYWMVWVGRQLSGSVHSRAELDTVLERAGVAYDHVRWEGDAEEDLREHGPLPPGTRRR